MTGVGYCGKEWLFMVDSVRLLLGSGLCLMLLTSLARAEDTPDTAPPAEASPAVASSTRPTWMHELDFYYSSVAVEIPIGAPVSSDGDELSEVDVYKRLWRKSLSPQIVMFEASVYPLPILGTWLKESSPQSYRQFDIGRVGNNTFNLMDAVTSGFQEPWAVSMFLGSAMNFQKEGDISPQNRGYMGYLLSYGAQHIWHNQLLQDPWWELEWKLKGEQRRGKDFLSWSFRLGLKEHGNPEIADLIYIGMRRNSLKFGAPLFDWLNNSSMEWKTEFDRRSFAFLRQELTVGCKLPFKAWGFAAGVDVGVIYEAGAKYSGSLSGDQSSSPWTVVLRPHFDF